MKALWFCVSLLLPLSICGQQHLSDALAEMNKISRQGGLINGVIKPSIEGYIGKGFVSFTYRGTLQHNKKEIAIKVTQAIDLIGAKHEYEIYSYLGAINNSSIEAYGIPSVYYFGHWNRCDLLAITLLDPKFNQRCKLRYVNELDILIVFREFVRSLKYIHSRGICHNDFHSDNIMFRGHKGFIIDFNLSFKMYESDAEPNNMDCIKKDWSRFSLLLTDDFSQITKDIRHTKDTKLNGLKRVYLAYNESLKIDGMPDYDGIYKIINEEIEKYQPAVVSWLTPKEKRIAMDDLRSPTSSIDIMQVPSETDHIHYPNVDYNFFEPEESTFSCSVM